MNKILIFLIVLCPLIIRAQRSVIIKVEELERPGKLLKLTAVNRIYQEMVMADAELNAFDVDKDKIQLPYNIIAKSKDADSLVNFGYHPFFNGMYQAYADHRPFVLSPDIMWLLISQGFARHINSEPEKYRKYFTSQAEKTTLVVNNQEIRLNDPDSPWEKIFPEFTSQLSNFAGKELGDVATANFSTTTSVSKVASQITLMEAVKPYFKFVVTYISCGIPEITLEGTTSDWKRLLEKTRYLRKYELDWWIDEVDPLLQQFVKASEGKADKDFWRNMFKYHTLEKYGAPKVIDGWIVKFFPYDKAGKRYGLKELYQRNNLPAEMVKVDLTYIETDTRTSEETPLEMWAGFTGLEQNKKTFALKPKIGWMIRKKDTINFIARKLKSDAETQFEGVNIQVRTVPKEVLDLKEITSLSIYFLDKILIPEEMGKMKIGRFEMNGTVSEEEIQRICKLLPDTRLRINDKNYNEF